MEGVEIVVRVHAGLQPHFVWGTPKPPLQGVAGLTCKGGHCAQHMEGVVLLVAQRGHIPGQLVQPSLYVVEVLYTRVMCISPATSDACGNTAPTAWGSWKSGSVM